MRKWATYALIVAVTLLLAGCVRPIQRLEDSANVSGSVTYSVQIALPADALMTVQLRDVKLWPDASGLISQQQITTSGSQSPIPFNVAYEPGAIKPDRTYALAAFIQDGNGHPLFVPGDPVPVITQGNPIQDVEVSVVPAQGNETVSTAPTVDPTALPGSSWSAILYNDGSSAIVSVTGVEITAEFGTDGQISGSSGCNDYTATYTTGEDQSIQIGPVTTTEKACSDPDNAMQQESQYLAALQSATTYQVLGQELTMQNADGQLAVQFVRIGP
jgi:putative lipoprotein